MSKLTTGLEVAGGVLVACGFGMIAVPLGVIVAGALAIGAGYLVAKATGE